MEFEPKGAAAAVLGWWRKLRLETGAARAARARLRRCTSVLEALLLEETHELIKAVGHAGTTRGPRDSERCLAVLAMTLAHIADASKTPLARALGQTAAGRPPTGEERPRLSSARFGALLRAAHAVDWDAFARALRRAFAILGDAPVDVQRLIDDVLFLNDAALQRWTYDYWQTRAPAEPQDNELSESSSTEMETAP